MITSLAAIGSHATIVDLLHSHARTRAYGSSLLGHEGIIVAILRNGTTALVELNDLGGAPGGIRRWSVHWDDLQVSPVPPPAAPHPACAHRAGLSGTGRDAVQHAVPPGDKISLCGVAVRPLPVCGWSVPFSPTVSRACSTCAALAETTP